MVPGSNPCFFVSHAIAIVYGCDSLRYVGTYLVLPERIIRIRIKSGPLCTSVGKPVIMSGGTSCVPGGVFFLP